MPFLCSGRERSEMKRDCRTESSSSLELTLLLIAAVAVASVRLRLVAEVEAVMMGRLIGGMLAMV